MEWFEFINEESKKEYFINLIEKVRNEYSNYICYPKYKDIFYAFKLTELNKVKVVILGQDPYHEPNQAHGLAFSVMGSKLPPSLVNIYKEIENDLHTTINQDGNLEYLAEQGVLLLNTILTVRQGMAFSHKGYGWEEFTDNTLKLLNTLNQPIAFILWGTPAIKKKSLLNNPNHLVIQSPHPSPLSSYRGFFGSKPFSKTNEYLVSHNLKEITWFKNDNGLE
ncbi:MAG: uracil-DNA glycosylase [Anaeroplasma sp.]